MKAPAYANLSELTQVLADFPARLESVVTPERTFECFKRIADTYAPTLTASHTRGPVLQTLLNEAYAGNLLRQPIEYIPDHLGSGAGVVQLGRGTRAPVWSVAHLDNICFLTGHFQNGAYAVTPFCQSRQNRGERPAVALSLDGGDVPARVMAKGRLITSERRGDSPEPNHRFETECDSLPFATRVCYETDAVWDRETGMVYGAIDNAACAAAQILALCVVEPYSPDVQVIWPDEEEGVVDAGPPSFARSSARLVQRTPAAQMPDLVVVSDIQDLAFDSTLDHDAPSTYGGGASFEAFTSRTRGTVTPPRLLAALRRLARELAAHDIQLSERGRYLNRSDDVSMVLASANIAHIGCPGAFTHFQDTPRAHLNDIMHLAKTLACLWMLGQSAPWRSAFTGVTGWPAPIASGS